ncbi:DUF1572 domain-containing protein [Hymenobacter ginsengisoli]|uniref:DUF1572 domain-containing protein n=1 Tax=Hymenobacter ginsengisoli TaxID=1051626 RepID=A0ABP8QQ97_9BACT|nr:MULTISPECIES: DUF1572 family protein [unclassified Hymenobacter]MBO2031244.1 DUF1572 domain-containing protein [Hymenobacter sp. BT559]
MLTDFLSSARKQFAYYKLLGEQAMSQVTDEQLHWQPSAESNSLATIVKHMAGNMLSRWTDFLTTDGEKPWREREAEFDEDQASRAEVLARWEAGWQCLFGALDGLTEADLARTIYIRNQGHSVTEAINRQLAHYPYHVGQLVFIARLAAGEAWQSLSIPRGNSAAYNAEKFAQPPHRAHFTDEKLSR